jgi:hypothetical protein
LNWFERITGFPETDYEETQSRLELRGTRLRSKVNRKEHEIGEFVMPTLAELRQEVDAGSGNRGVLKVSLETGDVRKFLLARENRGALFQVASQFNMLEMTGPSVTPEDGVTRYQLDPTQGPACAVAAGAATIYRNYLVPVDGVQGQRADRQLDGLSDLGAELSRLLGKPIPELWGMRNGYALCTSTGLAAIDALLEIAGEPELDEMRSLLRIGLHRNVQVTEILGAPPALGVTSVLFGLTRCLFGYPQRGMDTVGTTRPGCSLRGHLAGKCVERSPRRVKHRIPDTFGGWRLRQSGNLDPRRHGAGVGIGQGVCA